jgi:hypothetical protein
MMAQQANGLVFIIFFFSLFFRPGGLLCERLICTSYETGIQFNSNFSMSSFSIYRNLQ